MSEDALGEHLMIPSMNGDESPVQLVTVEFQDASQLQWTGDELRSHQAPAPLPASELDRELKQAIVLLQLALDKATWPDEGTPSLLAEWLCRHDQTETDLTMSP